MYFKKTNKTKKRNIQSSVLSSISGIHLECIPLWRRRDYCNNFVIKEVFSIYTGLKDTKQELQQLLTYSACYLHQEFPTGRHHNGLGSRGDFLRGFTKEFRSIEQCLRRLTLELDFLGSNPSPATYQLCEFRQATNSLSLSFLIYKKGLESVLSSSSLCED